MPFGLQPTHLVLILIAAIVLFGPKQLPALGKGLGKAITEFRDAIRQPAESHHPDQSSATDERKQ
jgi:sec-independent protein translocase protein TatA